MLIRDIPRPTYSKNIILVNVTLKESSILFFVTAITESSLKIFLT